MFGLLTALLYGVFLFIQTSRHRSFFTDPQNAPIRGKQPDELEPHTPREIRPIIVHVGLLFATLLSVVLMTKPMATLLDHGIEQIGMPTSLGAILIALLVLSPEGVAAYNAAARNQLQREFNLSLGSALSTLGMISNPNGNREFAADC